LKGCMQESGKCQSCWNWGYDMIWKIGVPSVDWCISNGCILAYLVPIARNIKLGDKPLSRDTSSHQISTKNLHSFRRYRA
jgi:hypothetical protein